VVGLRAPSGIAIMPRSLRSKRSPRMIVPWTPEKRNFARRALALMRGRPFRRYIIGSAISDTGDVDAGNGAGWVMSALTNQALMLGMVNFAAGIDAGAHDDRRLGGGSI